MGVLLQYFAAISCEFYLKSVATNFKHKKYISISASLGALSAGTALGNKNTFSRLFPMFFQNIYISLKLSKQQTV